MIGCYDKFWVYKFVLKIKPYLSVSPIFSTHGIHWLDYRNNLASLLLIFLNPVGYLWPQGRKIYAIWYSTVSRGTDVKSRCNEQRYGLVKWANSWLSLSVIKILTSYLLSTGMEPESPTLASRFFTSEASGRAVKSLLISSEPALYYCTDQFSSWIPYISPL